MQLTDPKLPWLLAVLAAALFIMLVVGWPRWHSRIARAATRGAQALVLNAVVVAVCFLLLNNAYVFYTSWSDVFGHGVRHVTTEVGGSAADVLRPVAGISLSRVPGTRDYALPDGRLRLQSYQVRDVASAATMQVLVHLPAGYNPASPHRYPVIIGLHGFPSVPTSFTKIRFLRTIDALTSVRRLQPSIVVIPQINNPRSLDTECVNGPVGEPQTDTWLSRELPEWVVRHFHVRTDRESWATLGYSFGGWCAAELAMRHPSVFAAAIDLEGYLEPDFGRTYDPMTPAMRRDYDLIHRARFDPPPVAVWVTASKQDPLSYPTTRRFIKAVRAPLVVSGTIVAVGGHRTSVFVPFIAPSLEWLARILPAFRG